MKTPHKISAWIASAIILLGVVAGAWIYLRPTASQRPVGPPEKLVIAILDTYIGTGLIFVAAANGYFADAGLEVALQGYTTGPAALAAAMTGKADLATAADTPLMFAVMRGQPIAIVATICTTGQDHGIVARKDRGVATPADLRGKRIAITLGTTGNYLLDAILTSSKTPYKQVRIINLKPEQMADALAKGDVDAVSTWEPYLTGAAHALGDNGIVFSAEGLYQVSINLAGRQDFVKQHPEAIRRVIRALARAEQFVKARPAEARAIVARTIKTKDADFGRAWSKYDLRLALDQRLITLLEAQARWAIRHQFVERRDVPNFLDFIYPDAASSVKPDAVSIIR